MSSRTERESTTPLRRLARGLTLSAVTCAAVAGIALVGSGTAHANYPTPPSPSQVSAMASEVAPAGCRTAPAPWGTIPSGLNANALCNAAVAGAPSPQAAGAIRYGFSMLGASYDQGNRYSINPPVFDCSSFIARAYDSAGGTIIQNGNRYSWVGRFGWTGAYMPSAYEGSNVRRISRAELQPGDVIILFDGSSPALSAGNNGHAQMYIGNGRVIESGGGIPNSMVGVEPMNANGFSNAWYFRYESPGGNSPVAIKYYELGGANGWLGGPVSEEYVDASGWRGRKYANGSIFWSPGTGAHTVGYGIRERFDSMGGVPSGLGLPVTDELPGPVPGSRKSVFQNGAIYWSAATDTRVLFGGVWQTYSSGGVESVMGMPTSDERAGAVPGSRAQDFQRGIIVWTGPTGAQAVYGGIGAAYRTLGADASALGVPTGPETNGNVPGSRRQLFQGGAIYWSGPTDARAVFGGVGATYLGMGADTSPLGLPTGNEVNGPLPGSRWQPFQGGSILWSAGTGARAVYGGIGARYVGLGGAGGALGLPVTDEINGPVPGSRLQVFQGGMITWSAAGGTVDVYGGVFGEYARLGGLGVLGMPLGSEQAAKVPGARVQNFQNGTILWSAGTGARALFGGIGAKYKAFGAETSLLGLPTTSEGDGPVPGSRRQDFQGGTIIWSGPTDAQVVAGGMAQRYLQAPVPAILGVPLAGEVAGQANGSRIQAFQNGWLYWSAGTGAQEVYGGIGARYRGLGGETSPLGMPTSGELPGPVAGSRMQTFQNGAVYWSGPTDAQPVYGGIAARYQTAKLAGVLGLPTGGEVNGASAGSRVQGFQAGRIYWSAGTGAYEVFGGILGKYLATGAETSSLGLPTSGEYTPQSPAGVRVQNFQQGRITYNLVTGAATVG